MPITGWVSQERVKIDGFRTHEVDKLIDLSGLRQELFDQMAVNLAVGGSLRANWLVVKLWQIRDRYSLSTTEREAKELFAAITDQPAGVLAWIMRFATKLKARRRIGNRETRGLYIDPPNFEMTPPGEIVHSVLRMLDRTGSASPSVVTLKDGSTIHAVPVGIRLDIPEGARIDRRDVMTSRERSVAADELVSIL